MKTYQVYIGMGGNTGDTIAILNQSLEEMKGLDRVFKLRCSRFYRTSPVDCITQDDYVNAVCAFETSLSPRELHWELKTIEKKLGKVPKPKNHPRPIDLDLLLYGVETVQENDLEIPHPSWSKRLFVLIPMRDLIDRLTYPDTSGKVCTVDLDQVILDFDNIHDEKIKILTQPQV